MKNKKLLAIILLSLSFCFVSGVGYGEDIPKKEAEPSKLQEQIDEARGKGMDVVLAMKIILLQSTLDYIMRNPHDFLFIRWEWDYLGLFHIEHALPESIIGKTEGKYVVQIFDNRSVFVDISEVALLKQFKKELERIYQFGSREKMDRDVVALLYDYEGNALSYFYGGEYRSFLGYFYQGEYHLWEE